MKANTQKKRNNRKTRLIADSRGLSTVEYVIILALIAIAAIGAWTNFGDAVIAKVQAEQAAIDGL
jgi:Flp pilus assembly pilin Flp